MPELGEVDDRRHKADAKALRQLLAHGREACAPAHLLGGHVDIGKRLHGGKLRRACKAADEQNGENQSKRRFGAKQRAGQQVEPHGDAVDDEQAAKAGEPQNRAEGKARDERAEGAGQRREACLEGRISKAHLQQQGNEEDDRGRAHVEQRAAAEGGGKGLVLQQAQVDDRIARAPCMADVESGAEHAHHEQGNHISCGNKATPHGLEAEDQGGKANGR